MAVETAKPVPRGGALRRIQATDLSTSEHVFMAAAVLLVPEDQTQRQAFEKLMPNMYVLRNRGCSWAQLTKLLTDCGFKLQLSTVRTYYGEMLARRLDICQERMNEQIALLKVLRKETEGTEVAGIADRVSAVMQRDSAAAAPKLDALFGSSIQRAQRTPLVQAPRAVAAPSRVEVRKGSSNTGQERQHPVEQADQGHFGLLNGPPGGRQVAAGKGDTPAFFVQDDSAPVVPDLKKNATHSNSPRAAVAPAQPESPPAPLLRCRKLEPGVSSLRKRDNVPPEVYEPGELEHPAIPGLALSLEQRLYGAFLEYAEQAHGEIYMETADQKRFRVMWKSPIPMTTTTTGKSFTKIDMELFGRNVDANQPH